MAAVVREQQRVRLALRVAARARPVEQTCHRRAGRLTDDLGVGHTPLGLGEDFRLAHLDTCLGRNDADACVAVASMKRSATTRLNQM